MPFPTFDKIDDVPEAFRSEYEEKDGKFVVKVEDVTGLKTALTEERTARKKAEGASKIATDENAKLKRDLEAHGNGADKAKIDAMLKKFDEDLAAAKQPLLAENEGLKKDNRSLKLESQAKQLFLDAGGDPKRVSAALKLAGDRLDLSEKGRVVVLDADGEVTTQTVEDFFGKSFKADMPYLYTGSGASGSDLVPTRGGPVISDSDLTKMAFENPQEALRIARERGTKAA